MNKTDILRYFMFILAGGTMCATGLGLFYLGYPKDDGFGIWAGLYLFIMGIIWFMLLFGPISRKLDKKLAKINPKKK